MNPIRKFLAARGADLLWAGAVTTFLGAAGVWTTASSVEKKSKAGIELAETSRKAASAPTSASPTPNAAKKESKKDGKRGARGPKSAKPTELAAAPSPSNGLPLEMEDILREKPVFGRAEISVNVQAVFGEVALINGAWIKVGQEQGGIKVVEFDGDKVILEIYGERVEKAIWEQPANKGPQKGYRKKESVTPVGESPGGGRGGNGGGRGQGGGQGASPEMREAIRQKFKSGEMSRDDLNKMYRNKGQNGGRGKAN